MDLTDDSGGGERGLSGNEDGLETASTGRAGVEDSATFWKGWLGVGRGNMDLPVFAASSWAMRSFLSRVMCDAAGLPFVDPAGAAAEDGAV
jgi:hypothetical protein